MGSQEAVYENLDTNWQRSYLPLTCLEKITKPEFIKPSILDFKLIR